MKSQLRQDLVSGDWIVISSNRSKRPEELLKKIKIRKKQPKNKCLFEDLKNIGSGDPILVYPPYLKNEKNHNFEKWKVAIVKNKYPAFSHKEICPMGSKIGPYQVMDAVGYHELVITRDHDKNFSKLSLSEAGLVFKAFKDRYLMLLKDKCLEYISIFQNFGPSAGASIYHPHYQIIGLPVIPTDIRHSLNGSNNYFKKHKKCVHCEMINWELKCKNRIIFENEGAVAFAPFFSKEPFEIRVFPKKHLPYFEDTSDADMAFVVKALHYSLKKITKNLNDPDYNFFIHTASIKDKNKYGHYHWHIEIIPRTTIHGGLEFGTGLEINIVDPDDAAKILKND
jgi:UDPglucose--hexose-1-phosphate uridylyltransferase